METIDLRELKLKELKWNLEEMKKELNRLKNLERMMIKSQNFKEGDIVVLFKNVANPNNSIFEIHQINSNFKIDNEEQQFLKMRYHSYSSIELKIERIDNKNLYFTRVK